MQTSDYGRMRSKRSPSGPFGAHRAWSCENRRSNPQITQITQIFLGSKGGYVGQTSPLSGKIDEFHRLNRNTEKTLKPAAVERSARLRAEVEEQLSAIYPQNDLRWVELTEAARN
jgi:hypothetical protein